VKLIDFLQGKTLYLAIVSFTSAAILLLTTLVFGVGLPFVLLTVIILLMGSLFALIPEYVIKRHYYQELKDMLANLDKKYLLSAIVEYPEFTEGRILYETLTITGKSMNDEIARFASESQEYREYIEMWVHEIKTPIAGMKLMAENTHDRDLLRELDRIDFLVEQLLFYARSNTVEKDYQIRQTALSDIVNTSLKSDARQLIAHKTHVHTHELDHTVLTDAKWTVFILRQLIDNSIKYGASNLEFSAEQRDGCVVFALRDDGVGIEEKDIARIFEKGFTGENGRRFGKATGLGLYLCQKLCDKLGLAISAQSTPGKGTTISVTFPKRDPFS
jgi:signal transduction histidine kinase